MNDAKNVRGGLLAPWRFDETDFLIFQRLENGVPILKSVKRRDFPNSLVKSKINTYLCRNIIRDFKCFYSQVNCYYVNWIKIDRSNNGSRRYLDWGITKEHLVSSRNQELFLKPNIDKTKLDGNTIIAGHRLNKKVGHNPLPLKLLFKKHLEQKEYNRDEPTRETFDRILRYIIDFEDQFQFYGKYPWQPWTYTDVNHKKAAEEIHQKMLDVELDFLKTPYKEKKQWLDNFNFSYISFL